MLEPGLSHVRLDELRESPDNPRAITDEAFERLKKALAEAPEMLEARPLIATLDGTVICGNMRLRALKDLEAETVPTFAAELTANERREWMLRDNNEFGDWKQDELAALVSAHAEAGGDLDLLGFASPEVDELLKLAEGGAAAAPLDPTPGPTLADRFGFPPFTVLDGRQWAWRQRKKEWLGLGIRSEVGRENVTGSISKGDPSAGDPQFYDRKTAKEQELGRKLSNPEFIRDHYTDPRSSADTSLAPNSTSVFDPTLCEVVYRWFSGEGQTVLDPFAGGSVRGIVAARLGRQYTGIDLSADQVAANRDQANAILVPQPLMGSAEDNDLIPDGPMPLWHHGDARAAGELAGESEPFDLLFTCPPYFNLEVYSDAPGDLSREPSWESFLVGYMKCLEPAVKLLADNRFAAIVVGDIREKGGRVLPLVSETIQIMATLGLELYNEAIYVTPVGSLRIRAARYFVESRKLGRTHQHLLVFVKGDGKVAADAAGVVDQAALQEAVDVLAEEDGEADPGESDGDPEP